MYIFIKRFLLIVGLDYFVCQFGQNNLCNMVQETADVLDWTLNSGSTLSKFTGPDDDAVPGFIQGYYVYIEASVPSVSSYGLIYRCFYIHCVHTCVPNI